MCAEVLSPVVSTAWLKSALEDVSSNVVILDVTWASNKDSYAEYKQCHIPGAKYFDIMHKAKHNDLFPRNIPETDDFESYARSRGVNSDSHVIVYDSTPLGGFFIGSRAWWMFKVHGHDTVSVLEGGLKKWIADGYPTSDVEPECLEGNFKANKQNTFVKTFDDMVSNVESKDFQVLDSRASSAFNGSEEDTRTGHLPCAKNFPFKTELLTADGATLKTKEQLTAAFQAAGVDLSRPVVSMCNSGMSSCSLALAAQLCGAKDIAVYHGGFTEWSNRASENLFEQTREKPN